MLREFTQVRQEPGPGSRRWFESDRFDLVVWFDRVGAVTGFQICYDLGAGEHALTWRPSQGCVHSRVDSGEGTRFPKRTPILVPDGVVPWGELTRIFDDRSAALEPPLRDLVRAALARR